MRVVWSELNLTWKLLTYIKLNAGQHKESSIWQIILQNDVKSMNKSIKLYDFIFIWS